MQRIKILKYGFVAFAAVIVGRAALLHIAADPRLARLANRQFNSKITALPRRGLIFDRNGEGLAMSLKAHSLFFRPEILVKELSKSERTRILFNLAKILHEPIANLNPKMHSEKGFVWVKRQLSDTEERQIRDFGLLDLGDGIGLAEETKRFYPNRELAAQTLGSVGVDGNGLEGLELFYEGILNGERSRIASNKDAMGRRIFQDGSGLLAFKDGQSLVLTLDKAIQYEAEKNLKAAIENFKAKAGTVIVAEVDTGEILAMANYPTFNPNTPKHADPESRRNRAITDTYEPGSTFKPFIIASSLEKGRSPKTQVYCERGSFKVGDRTISEAEADEKFEWLTYGEVLKFSSNIGAAKLALDLGPSTVAQMMDRLGVGKRTDIDLPGEVSGSVNVKELSSQVRLANVGFGHGFTVTPLQMLTYYLAIANGGKWIQPKLVKAILAEDPDSLERGSIRWKLGHRFDTLKTRKILTPLIASQITKMLETVVDEKGTGTLAQLEEWPVAGKTGTAQKIDPETKRYSRNKHMASFIGFAPAKSPKLVAFVLLDEPEKHYAGTTAAPLFREVMQASLIRERVAPTDVKTRMARLSNKTTIEQIKAEASSAVKKDTTHPTNIEVDSETQRVKLPDLRGLSVRDAIKELSSKNIAFEISGTGVLREQTPSAGVWVASDTKVKLVFEKID